MPARPLAVSDQRVLSALAGDGTVSFQGLRRLIGLHPQTLSRILKRLRESGLVEEGEGGYRLASGTAPADPAEGLPALPVPQSASLLHMALHSPEAAAALAAALTGKWFRSLRWLGKARVAGMTVLAWMVEPDGVVLRLVIEDSGLRIEVAAEAAQDPQVHEGLRALMPAVALALPPIAPSAGPRLMLAA